MKSYKETLRLDVSSSERSSNEQDKSEKAKRSMEEDEKKMKKRI